MKFDTNTLGYKLVNDTLKDHSEQLDKYVAGLFDTDGYIGFEWTNGVPYIRCGVAQAATVDTDFQMLRCLQRHYGIGRLTYGFQANDVSQCYWRLSGKDTGILFNRIGKHMRVKQSHFKNLIELNTEGYTREDLAEYSKKSRRESCWLKRPKHLSYAYVAGLIDGDGCYRIRKKNGKVASICVKVAMQENFILDKLQEDFGGSINPHSEGMRCWRRGLGKGHMKFSLPFLKKMRQYSCIENKYLKIDEMIRILQAAETKRSDILTDASDSPIVLDRS